MDNFLHPRQSSRRRRQQRQENRHREEPRQPPPRQPPSYEESQRQPSYEESMNSTRPGGVWGTYATPRNDDLDPISYDSHMQRQRRHELSLQQHGVPQHPQLNVGNPLQLPWAPQPTQPTQPMSAPGPGLSDNEIARGGQALSEMRQRREQHEQQQRERQEHERRLQEQNVPQVPPMPPMPALQLPPSMQPQPRPPGSGGQRRR